VSGATSRRKGSAAELAVVHALRRAGWEAVTSRNAQGGRQGGPDIVTDFPVALEVKDHAKLDLAGWLKQAEAQAFGVPAAVVHKKRGKGQAEDWYCTLTFGALLDIVANLTEHD
jgi:Holliday junction resolvase